MRYLKTGKAKEIPQEDSVEYTKPNYTLHKLEDSELEDSDESIISLDSADDGDVESLKKKKGSLKVYAQNCDHKALKFELGMRFKDCEEWKEAIILWAILNGYNIKWMKSGGSKLEARCVDNCPWRLYASKLTMEPTCVIKTYISRHTCIRANKNRQATSKWIGNMFVPKLKANPKYSAKDMQRDCQLTYGIIVPLLKCYRAKWKALKQLRGTFQEHYSKIRSYVAELMNKDDEGRFVLKTYLDNDNNIPIFQRVFIGFSCLRKGFLVGCRKVIGFDACFLKTVLGGALLAAVAKDCNMKMYPIAWAVVEKESEETWSWFFEILFQELNIGDGLGWTFMSDKQKVYKIITELIILIVFG